MRLLKLFDRVRNPPLVISSAAPEASVRSVVAPVEAREMVPLLVMAPARVEPVPFW